jgi:peptide/nickel transport system substrate-binding protein
LVARLSLALALSVCAAVPLRAAEGDVVPKRGGTLECAVTVEADGYDCGDNTSFAFLHPVAPQYSMLLKFDAPAIRRSSASWPE